MGLLKNTGILKAIRNIYKPQGIKVRATKKSRFFLSMYKLNESQN